MADDLFTSYKATLDNRSAGASAERAREVLAQYAPPVEGKGKAAGPPPPPPRLMHVITFITGLPMAGLGAAVSESVGPMARDMGRGLVETPRAIAGGVRDIAQGVVGTVDDLAMWLEDKMPLGGIDGSSHEELLANRARDGAPELPDIKAPDSVTGGIVRSATRFLGAFLPIKFCTCTGRFALVSCAESLTCRLCWF